MSYFKPAVLQPLHLEYLLFKLNFQILHLCFLHLIYFIIKGNSECRKADHGHQEGKAGNQNAIAKMGKMSLRGEGT